MSGRGGRYRIHVVEALTGVPAATLRAWERRYGVPAPARTASAYRVYSDEDVATVRRLKALCDEGMAIAEAAAKARGEARPPEPAGRDAFGLAADRLVAAVERYDLAAIEDAVMRATYLGPAAAVFDRAFGPALEAIGASWADGRITVAQEHLASGVVETAARALLRSVQPEGARCVALVACFADEEHVLPALGASLRLAARGCRVVDLGARVPPEALGDAVARLAPDLVALSATSPPEKARARALLDAYAAACRAVPWVVGGAAAGALGAGLARRGAAVVATPEDERAAIERCLAAVRRRRSEARATR